jgi:N-acetylglucosamine-6-sulfatase
VLVFTSDNGFFFGEHGLSIERRLPYEESIRMPLLLRYPGLAAPGGKVRELASSIDIAPTLLDLAGIAVPAHMQGRSMRRALDGRTRAQGRAGVLTEYYSHDLPMPWTLDADYRAVRTERYKLIDWVQYPELWEVYDLHDDPYEMANLAGTPRGERLRAALRPELLRLIGESVGL